MQIKLYLIGQDIFHFVDGSLLCPPSHVVVVDGYSLQTNPFFFLCWKQKDQLILSALLSYLSMDVLILFSIAKPHIVFFVLLRKP